MRVVKMTERWLRATTVAKGRTEYADAIVRGLRIHVSPRSKKWSVITRKFGRRQRIQLGDYPNLALQQARAMATGLLDQEAPSAPAQTVFVAPQHVMVTTQAVALVQYAVAAPPAAPKTVAVPARFEFEDRAEAPEDLPTIEELCADYVQKMRDNGQGSASAYARNLIRGEYSFCKFMTTQKGHPHLAVDVTTVHVTEWLSRTYQRRPTHARHCRAYLNAVFNWGLKAGLDFTSSANRKSYGLIENPVATTPPGGRHKSRNRVLTIRGQTTLGCPSRLYQRQDLFGHQDGNQYGWATHHKSHSPKE